MGTLRSEPRSGASGHDRGYKLLFSDPTLVEELLRGFLPGSWTGRLDFTTLERVGKSFVSDDLHERHSDLIWRLRLRGEEEGWVYLCCWSFNPPRTISWPCGYRPTPACC